MLLTEILRKALKLYPNKQGLVCGKERLTYRKFGERVNRLSNTLWAQGIRKGDRLAILHRNCHRYLEAYFGAVQIGAILVPLNHRLSACELAFILNDAQAKALMAEAIFEAAVESTQQALEETLPIIWCGDRPEDYEAMLTNAPSASPPRVTIEEDDIAQIYYTSGTTGRQKGVILSHRNVYAHALGSIAELHFTDSDVWLHAAPMFHLADAWASWTVTWVGGTHVFVSQFDVASVLGVMEQERVTITNMVPTMWNMLVNYPGARDYDFSSLRVLMSGGAPIAPELMRRMMETFDCDFIQTYGMTETSPYLTLSILKKHLRALPDEQQLDFKARTGREFVNVELRVVREDGTDVAWDNNEVGEIIVRGDTVTRGYWKSPEATSQAIRDGWLYTGDLAVIDEEGYVNIVDRKKDMIITGGENVYSIEVENVLYEHPAVLEAAVIGVPDEVWGETVKAMVVLREGKKAKPGELIDFCRERLANYKVPKSVDFVDSLPRTGSGKIHKKALRDGYWQSSGRQVDRFPDSSGDEV